MLSQRPASYVLEEDGIQLGFTFRVSIGFSFAIRGKQSSLRWSRYPTGSRGYGSAHDTHHKQLQSHIPEQRDTQRHHRSIPWTMAAHLRTMSFHGKNYKHPQTVCRRTLIT